MNKILKISVIAIIMLALITISLNVNASVSDLSTYVTEAHVVNGMIFELNNSQKVAVRDYLASSVSDSQADSAQAKINQAMSIVQSSGVTNVNNLTADQKSQIISLATSAASDVGLTLKVNTADNTYTLSSSSKVLASGSIYSNITYQGTSSNSSSSSTATTGKTLLYTGSSYVYVTFAAVAIVTVSVVAKKRA